MNLSQKPVLRVETYRFSGKENVPGADFTKEGYVESLL